MVSAALLCCFMFEANVCAGESATSIVSSPSRAQAIVGSEPVSYTARCLALKALRVPLADQECAALRDFLERHDGGIPLPREELNGLKNAVVNRLRQQEAGSPALAQALLRMADDKRHDEVWRDYCVQHLGGMCEVLEDSRLRQEVGALLWTASRETQGSIGGTALIALFQNRNTPGIERSRVAERALEVCKDSKAGEAVRMTAFQICADLGDKRVLPPARQVVDAKANVPLRMSAIAVLGKLGDETDRERLKPCANSTDVRLRTAARAALARLK